VGDLHAWGSIIRAIHGSVFEAVDTFVRILFIFSSCRSALIISFDRDQVVTLTTTTPHRQVRVVGITKDHGLLRTFPEWSGTGRFGSTVEYIDLQPDGNSFDLMANLIKSKTQAS
jgi:hypothetical protein